jgi:lipopolysaccharide export LptBFGC system permease protein LptF
MFTRLLLLSLMALTVSFSVTAVTNEQKLAAWNIIKQRQLAIQQATDTLSELSEQIKLKKEELTKSNVTEPSTTVFAVQRAIFHWDVPSTFKSHKDYEITMDFRNDEHNKALEKQYLKWIEQGWFIEKSVITKDENDVATLQVRIVNNN